MNYDEARRLSDKQKEGLRQLLFYYPAPAEEGSCTVHFNTFQSMGDPMGLVETRKVLNDPSWGATASKDSDRVWEAKLTPKGVYAALLLGFRPHTEEQCIHAYSCPMHWPHERSRIPVPTLEAIR